MVWCMVGGIGCAAKVDYDVGALNNCVLAKNVGVAFRTLGEPQVGWIDKKGNGRIGWKKEARTLVQEPLDVETRTGISPYGGLDGRTIEVETRTRVSGGGLRVRHDLCEVYMIVKDWRVERYDYFNAGIFALRGLGSAHWLTEMLAAAKRGDLRVVSEFLGKYPRMGNTDFVYHLALEAARNGEDNVAAWLVQEYGLDVKRKVRFYESERKFFGHAPELGDDSDGMWSGWAVWKSIADVARDVEKLRTMKTHVNRRSSMKCPVLGG